MTYLFLAFFFALVGELEAERAMRALELELDLELELRLKNRCVCLCYKSRVRRVGGSSTDRDR